MFFFLGNTLVLNGLVFSQAGEQERRVWRRRKRAHGRKMNESQRKRSDQRETAKHRADEERGAIEH
jgi:hypothetical protein